MTRVAIMTDEVGWHTRQLQAALRERGVVGRCVDLADCRIDTSAAWHGLAIPGFGRELPDAVLVRGIAGGSFEQVTKRLGVLHALRELGVPVYNDARAIERSVDKSMTSLLLHAAGIPTPATWAMESPAQAQRLVMRESAAGRALVLKPLFGSQGKGLQLVGSVDGVHHPLPDLKQGYGGLAYLQRFVPPLTQPGFDWRVLVVGGRAVTAMRRVSAHWVHNVAQGARCEPATLDEPLARLAEDAARALEMDYAGIDILPCGATQSLQVIEVNGVAAWQGLQRVTAFNIARALVDDLLDRRLAASRRGAQRA
ncbi:RimK family alpha-L-glutamate ligase [Piscinibacter sp.]|jgi:tetrahydromethanopterin:alpha-L-glutamate ligase|uniref:ATP-grasp domain-containing protein n=1 Tax=Piscinibacter sp. TaxID=1903157 RepID=UPI001E02FB72|nr:RimK family alpha-L-glutamate ligase [Piscinibacter sp.]MBK7533114.1 RimK family alpha-L-glutamate ligase [Piscinibacter sp.]HOY37066.1 RimK family alpha-L-glutamate ligase [Piscinibacter sp.]HPG77266.1 RimK family alpha-L-glutamate ligase [Piscinibacter sp.]